MSGLPDERRLRAAIVGAGTMGRWHARAIVAAGGRLAAVVDRDRARARALAGGAPALSTVEELARLAHPPDVVHVCTPVGCHVADALAAIALPAHVIVEKPVAPDAASTRALLETAAAAGRLLVPVHQFLFQPGVLRLLEGREELGDLVHCSFVAASAGAEGGRVTPDALVADILPHPLSLFARLLPGRIDEARWDVARPVRGELRASASAAGATLAVVLTSRARPTRAELEVLGTRASAVADLYHGFSAVERGGPTRARKVARPLLRGSSVVLAAGRNLAVRAARRETAYPGLRELVRRTYAAVATGGPAPVTPAEALAVAAARDAILAA